MTAIRWLASTIAVALSAGPDAAAAGPLVFSPPLDLAAGYPAAALHEGIEGRAVVACTLGSNGDLTGCEVKSEEPVGYGFGTAAIGLVTASRLDIVASEMGTSVGLQIAIPLVFKLTGEEPVHGGTTPAS